MKIAFFIVLIYTTVFSAPNLYSSLGVDIEQLSSDCKIISKSILINNSVKKECSDILVSITTAFNYGYKLDEDISHKSVDKKKTKKYLFDLRRIKKNITSIIRELNYMKKEAINKNNISLFSEIIALNSIKLNRLDINFMQSHAKLFEDNHKYKSAIDIIKKHEMIQEKQAQEAQELENLILQFETAVDNRKFKKAGKLLHIACRKGSDYACNKLAEAYKNGAYGIKQNSTKAINLFKSACENSSAGACLTTAILIYHKSGLADSQPWYEQACRMNNANACAFLGSLYEKRNPSKAKKYYSKACSYGHGGACYNLGAIYWNGDGTIVQPEGIDKAMPYFKKACDLGISQGCYKINVLGRSKL